MAGPATSIVDLAASPLSRELARHFAGGAAASEIQSMAAAALAEYGPDVTSPSVKALAGIGSSGRLPGNSLRDLFRLQWANGATVDPPDLYWIEAEFQSFSAGAGHLEQRRHPLLLPHDYLACLGRDASLFEQVLLGAGLMMQTWCQTLLVNVGTCLRKLARAVFPM